jgi:hypothetical protein
MRYSQNSFVYFMNWHNKNNWSLCLSVSYGKRAKTTIKAGAFRQRVVYDSVKAKARIGIETSFGRQNFSRAACLANDWAL